MNKSFILALSLAMLAASGYANDKVSLDVEYQCHRALRAFVREMNPNTIVGNFRDAWKKVDDSTDILLKIESNYIMNTYNNFKKQTSFCTYDVPTRTVISVSVSPPSTPIIKSKLSTSKEHDGTTKKSYMGLGSSEKYWISQHKVTGTCLWGSEYDNGLCPVFIDNKLVSIYAEYYEKDSFSLASLMERIQLYTPADSEILKKFKPYPDAIPESNVIKYYSKSLSKMVNKDRFQDEGLGVFHVTYGDYGDGRIADYILTIGSK